MSIFSKIGKGIKNATKFVGKKVIKPVAKGAVNATKWQVNNIAKAGKYAIENPEVLAMAAAGVATGGAALGAIAPVLGSKLASSLGKSKVGSILGKTIETGVVLNKKLKGTLKKNNLPSSDKDADALAEFIRQKAADEHGIDLLKNTTIDANYKTKNALQSSIEKMLGVGSKLFGNDQVAQTGVEMPQKGGLLGFAQNLFNPKSQKTGLQSENNGLLDVVKSLVTAQNNKQPEGESTIDKLMMLKMMDSKPDQQPEEKENFFEKLFMMKEIMKPEPSNIQVENQAQATAFQQIQNELQQSKFAQMLEKAKPNKTVLIVAGLAGAALLIFSIFQSQPKSHRR